MSRIATDAMPLRQPLLRMVDDLLSRKSDNVAWLERAGPIAKRLNEEAQKDRAA